jgi:hypothetical protein
MTVLRVVALNLFAGLLCGSVVASDDKTLFRNYEYVCENEVNWSGTELRVMLCKMLKSKRDLVERTIQLHIEDVCRNISKQCASPINDASKGRFSQFSQQLGCSGVGVQTNCLNSDGDATAKKPQSIGDVELLIEFIDTFEQAGARVPRGLRMGIGLYAESLQVGRDVSNSIERINLELKAFNSDVEKGCRELEEETVYACLAAIDRTYLARNFSTVLGWSTKSPSGGPSLAKEVATKAVERWAEQGRQ